MIELQYFEGCPNSFDSLNNLQELVKEGFIKEEQIKIVEVQDLDAAEKIKFQGSPTILVNGVDIYTEKMPETCSYTCRIYNIDNQKTGVLAKEYIKEKISKLITESNRS